MQLSILPYEGVGPIRFGMRASEVRQVVGGSVREFLKTPESKAPTDAFDSAGIHVYYSEAGECEAVEIGTPGDPLLRGRSLVGQPFEDVHNWIKSLDEGVEVDDTGLTSPSLGLGVYAPAVKKQEDSQVEAVIVFRRGYYEHA